MPEHRNHPQGGHDDPGREPESFDRELSVRPIVLFLVGLAVLMAVTAWVMWLMYGGLRGAEQAKDPQPSPLAAARVQRTPPEPRLQSSPEADLAAMRAEEQQVFTSYGWSDQARHIARIPVERAMERILTAGLPDWPEPAPQAGTDAK